MSDSRQAERSCWQSPVVGQLRLWSRGHAPNPFRPEDLMEAVGVVDYAAAVGWPSLVQWTVQRWGEDGAGGFGWVDVPAAELDAAREAAQS